MLPKTTLLLLSIACLPGCATILGSTTQYVSVDSSPSGATISIVNQRGAEVFRGTTPTTVLLKKGIGYFRGADYVITAELEGFSSRSIPVERGLSAWYYLGNIFFGGLIGILIVDPATGAMWKIDEHPDQIILDPIPDAANASPLESPPIRIPPV